MSLLLEALQRSRSEARETRGGVPDLDTVIVSDGGARKTLLVRVSVPVLVFVALLLGWLFRGVPAGLLDALPSRQLAEVRPQPQRLPQPQPEASVGKAPELQREGASLEAAPRAGPEVALLYKNRNADWVGDKAVAGSGQAPAKDVGAGDGSPLDIEAMVKKAEKALVNQGLEAHSSPLLEELPQSLKDALPTLMYLRHDYRSGGVSRVTINRREAGVGDPVASGVEVVEILTDAVVLRFQDQVFRLRALNSWVNL